MARFRMTQAFSFGSNRVRAGGTLADTVGNAQPGDLVYAGLTAATLPPGCIPLDAAATTMKNASKFAGEAAASSITGADSIDA